MLPFFLTFLWFLTSPLFLYGQNFSNEVAENILVEGFFSIVENAYLATVVNKDEPSPKELAQISFVSKILSNVKAVLKLLLAYNKTRNSLLIKNFEIMPYVIMLYKIQKDNKSFYKRLLLS